MTTTLLQILERLEVEGLHGPISPYKNRAANEILYPSENDYEEADDPRWADLFVELLVTNGNAHNDDLLFFVRQVDEDNDEDPVFVKRKGVFPNVMPTITDDIIMWNETFWLNLIVQLPCELFVAVCRQEVDKKTSMTCSRIFLNKKVYALPTKSRMDTKEVTPECSYPVLYYVIDDFEDAFEQHVLMEGEHLCVELSVTVPGGGDVTRSAGKRSKPSEDQLDGDARTGADDDVSDIEIDSEKGQNNGRRWAKRGPLPKGNSPYIMPFPPPSSEGDYKITLFQGALSYIALKNLYHQKVAGKINRRFKLGPPTITPPTVYVGVRGPNGKGHAQLAVTGVSRSGSGVDISSPSVSLSEKATQISNSKSAPSSPTLSPSSSTPVSLKNPLSEITNPKTSGKLANRSTSSTSIFSSLKRLGIGEGSRNNSRKNSDNDRDKAEFLAPPEKEVDVTRPDALKCCLTFVNVDWRGIASDLMSYNRSKRSL